MNYSDNYEYLEIPFGPPPILPDIKTELEKFIVYPEKLPIHQLNKVQQCWERHLEILTLLKTDISSFGTNIKFERDPITCRIENIQEVYIQHIGKTVRNSMSMSRAPGPITEDIRGNSSNFLFWPGGFDTLKRTNINENIKVDFEKNLRTVAKGFRSGIEFMSDNSTPNSLYVLNKELYEGLKYIQENNDIKSFMVKESHTLAFWTTKSKSKEGIENLDDCETNYIKVPNIDEFIKPFDENKIPILNISEIPKKNIKTEWAEQINVMVPVIDFEKKIPDAAKLFPYELDNFQKQAILKLEEQCNVFVAAHTSAGKTTIAEYAIAMSQKHMTRTIYTSPIKALSNQKFREFKEKFNNVGLITGDVQINSTAMCLIMTTEILQSMLYCAAEVIRDVEYVVFDEVHYINDEDRGHVWEEVIILLPPTITIVMLSATVPNPLEFAHWVGQIKKEKMYVISTLKRPVPLQHYLYTGYDKKTKDQIFLFIDKNGRFIRDRIKEAEEAKKNSLEKQSKIQQIKYYNTKQKPSLVTKLPSTIWKNASAEETMNAVILAKEYEEALEDKIKINMITTMEKRKWLALLDHLQSMKKLPVVIFILSRNRCDKTANAFTESLLTHAEQENVKEFFKKSIRNLKGTDSQLPQVLKMQKLLCLGIGVHHSGILPILKEIVEMLFQKGIVKVLFATETFAMGVNMPTKTVVFDSTDKYDGNSTRNLLPTEYIQMAGRAGRRGHDETGTVIVLCKKKVPSEKELKDMALGEPQNLVSKFKVTYLMVLHLKRLSEAISIDEMMRRSFKEMKSMSNEDKNKHELEKVLNLIEQSSLSMKDENDLETFYDSVREYLDLWQDLRPHILEAKKNSKAFIEGRILLISYQHHYNKLGIFLGYQNKTKILYKVFVLTTTNEEVDAKTNVRPNTWYEIVNVIKKNMYKSNENPTHEILILPASSIIEVINKVVDINCKFICADWEKRQIPRFKDALPSTSCEVAMKELLRITIEVHKNPTIILPYMELKQSDFDLQQKDKLLQNKKNKLSIFIDKIEYIPNFEDKFYKVFKQKELEKKKQQLLCKLSVKNFENYLEYESRLKVLKELNYIDNEDQVTLKGRVALEMGTYEIFLTELVLDNVLTNWQPEEIAAILSSLVCQYRKNEEEKDEEIPKLNELKKEVMKVYNRLVNTEKKYLLEPRPPPSFQLIRVVYEWACNKPFSKIMELTNVQEGIIVRCIQQLNETLQYVKNAAIIIGHPALKTKMEEASTKIKRDIVFTASLYTQD